MGSVNNKVSEAAKTRGRRRHCQRSKQMGDCQASVASIFSHHSLKINAIALPQTKTTFDTDSYMAWEETQAERYEYWSGEVFAMSGGSDANYTITLNLATVIKTGLAGSPCRPFVAGMKVQIKAADAILHPDVFVTSDNRDKTSEANLAKAHPALIAEVLSNSTAAYERSRKFELYQQIPELQEYPIIEQDRQHADLFRKNAEELWALHPIHPGDTIMLNSLNQSISLATLYEDVEFNHAVG